MGPSYDNPLETMATNALGSANLLNSLRKLTKPVVAVMITSDKAYDNVEWAWGYRETDTLGGKDPYSASKGMAELAIRSFVESYFRSSESNVVWALPVLEMSLVVETGRMIVSYRTVFELGPAERLWIYAVRKLHGRGNMFWNP